MSQRGQEMRTPVGREGSLCAEVGTEMWILEIEDERSSARIFVYGNLWHPHTSASVWAATNPSRRIFTPTRPSSSPPPGGGGRKEKSVHGFRCRLTFCARIEPEGNCLSGGFYLPDCVRKPPVRPPPVRFLWTAFMWAGASLNLSCDSY